MRRHTIPKAVHEHTSSRANIIIIIIITSLFFFVFLSFIRRPVGRLSAAPRCRSTVGRSARRLSVRLTAEDFSRVFPAEKHGARARVIMEL